jgi:hypothetical protein
LDFFIQLPQGTTTVLDGNSQEKTRTTYLGPKNIGAMTARDFKYIVLDVTGQELPATLVPPPYGQVIAELDTSIKDENIRNTITGRLSDYIVNEPFKALCPSLTNNPSDALAQVSQGYKDANGNTAYLTIHNYFTKLMAAVGCIPDDLDCDVCARAVDRMNPEIKKYLCLTYSGHRINRPRDKFTQMTALLELKTLATKAENIVAQLKSMVAKQTNDSLSAVPGLTAAVPALTTGTTTRHSDDTIMILAASPFARTHVSVNASQAEIN